jgi:hypothetical protein
VLNLNPYITRLFQVGGIPNTASGNQQAAARRVIVMCLAIATTFTLTTLPLQIAVYVLVLVDRAAVSRMIIYFRTLAMFNTCVNPVIYSLLWRPFRVALVQVLVHFFAKSRPTRVQI